jgi:putative membrane-bound dehydrogenase-like protein
MKRWLPLLLLASALSLPSARAQVPPDRVLKTFKVSPGLELSLWASEEVYPRTPQPKEKKGKPKPHSDWSNPTCMDVDHRGRVWVCESVNYRSKLGRRPLRRPEGDRILILEDTKGTGKADKVTVFYQSPDTLAPLGIAVAPDPDGPGCKVFVCQSPDILVFEDKDGDGKADGPARKLLSGFRGYDHDHGVHGILIGPDGRLYFSVGDQGVQGLVDKHGKKWSTNNSDCRAGTIWRCDLDGKNLELIAHNFRNEYEPCVDSFGTVLVSDNDDDGNQQTRICYVMPGGNYGYWPRGRGETHWHEEQPGVVPRILRTYFGSPTGMCVYEGTLLPKQYHGQPLHTDAGPRHVRCYHLTPQGASYAVKREDLVESSDNWFRPSDVCVAPDGSVYVADWYDPGVGGHGMGDTTRGRIYRLAPPGNRPSVPKVDLSSKEGITAALASPNLAVRHMAMAKLQAQGLPKALEVLEPAAVQKKDVHLRARALWQLGRLGSLRFVVGAYADPDPRFRVLAMRILHDTQGQSPADYIPDWKERLLKDPSPAVRREALLLLRDVEPRRAKSLILDLARQYDGKDRFYLAAVGIAVGQDKGRRQALLGDFGKQFPQWSEKVAGLVWELRPPEILSLLETRLGDARLPAGQRAQLVDILAGSPDPGAGSVLLKALLADQTMEVRQRIVENLKLYLPGKWGSLRKGRELGEAIDRALARAETRLAGLALIGAAERTDAVKKVAALAASAKESPEVRVAAVQALGQFKDPAATDALVRLTGKDVQSEDVGVEAVVALGRQATPAALKLLREIATDPKEHKLPQRQAAVAGLAASRPGTTWLLQAHKGKDLAADLVPDLARLLRNSPYPDLRNKALVAFPPPKGKFDPNNLPGLRALLARKGNAKRGEQLMLASLKSDAQCLKCHTIKGVGGNVGPDLSVIGSKASRENLLESIVYPSRAISFGYDNWVVVRTDGVQLIGLIVEDRPKYVVLRDANAKDHKIATGDIERRSKVQKSLMPDDLIRYLSEEDLIDLVDYLYSLKSPPLTPGSARLGGRDPRRQFAFAPPGGAVFWRGVKAEGERRALRPPSAAGRRA